MKAIFNQIPDKKKMDSPPDNSDASDEDYASDESLERYKAPLNDKYPRSTTPGAEGNERGMYDRRERHLRAFYDLGSDDEEILESDKERNLERPAKTPPGQSTFRSHRAQNILRNDRKDPEVSAQEFARLVDNPRYADLLARKRKSKKGGKKGGKRKKSPYNAPPYKIRTLRRENLQLRL